jgi:hypothetical protein
MSSTAPPKNVPESLEVIAKYVSASAADAPVEFVRDLAHRWKERGGLIAGKPRHSDRYLDDLLRALGTPIKSLTPKLVGRTNLRPADASVLVHLFLTHWDYIGDPGNSHVGASADLYRPMLADDSEIEGVSRYVAERVSAIGLDARIEPEPGMVLAMPGEDMSDVIATEFQASAAYFQVGPGQTVLVPQPEKALIGFRNLMDRLWEIDEADDHQRILIWALDLGRLDFDDLESRLRFMNVEAVISRFKALLRFRDISREARWNWLQSKTVIALHDTLGVRPDVPMLPAFDPNHVLFSAIPPRWAGLSSFLTLYGSERLHEANYSIFLRRPAEETLPTRDTGNARGYEFNYYGHAVLKSDTRNEFEARSMKLNAPGRSYVDALGTVFVAAMHVLGLQTVAELQIDGMKIDPSHAREKLRHHGFSLMRLDEFLTHASR